MPREIKKDFSARSRKPDIASLVYAKVPPQSIELENAVLGVLLLERDRLDDVLAIIPSEECFYVDANRKIYECILKMHKELKDIDLLTVVQELSNMGYLELIGGAYYITKLTADIVTGANVESWASIVMEKYLLRELIRLSGETIRMAYEDCNPFEIQSEFITEANKIFENGKLGGWEHITDVAAKYLQIHENRRKGDNKTVYSTTFDYIDNLNVGIRENDFVLVGARPGVGKSAFVLPWAKNWAINNGAGGIINLEMTNPQTFGRMMSHHTDIAFRDLDMGYNISDEMLIKYAGELSKLPIYFTSAQSHNINSIVAAINWLVKKKGARWVIIDYLQLIQATLGRNREQEVANLSKTLKGLANAHRIPIIALSQINRVSAGRANRKPEIHDLRESGALEQDADIVFLLHRDWQAGILANPDGSSTENEADIIIAKWRNGKTGDLKVNFEGKTMRFSEKRQHTPFEPPTNHNRAMNDAFQRTLQASNDNTLKDDLPF